MASSSSSSSFISSTYLNDDSPIKAKQIALLVNSLTFVDQEYPWISSIRPTAEGKHAISATETILGRELLPKYVPVPLHLVKPDEKEDSHIQAMKRMASWPLFGVYPIFTPNLLLLLTGSPSDVMFSELENMQEEFLLELKARCDALKEEGKDPSQDDSIRSQLIPFCDRRKRMINLRNEAKRYRPTPWYQEVTTCKVFSAYLLIINMMEGRNLPERSKKEFSVANELLFIQWKTAVDKAIHKAGLDDALEVLRYQIISSGGIVYNWNDPVLLKVLDEKRILWASRIFTQEVLLSLEDWILNIFRFPKDLHRPLSIFSQPTLRYETAIEKNTALKEILDIDQQLLNGLRETFYSDNWNCASRGKASFHDPTLLQVDSNAQQKAMLEAFCRSQFTEDDHLKQMNKIDMSLDGTFELKPKMASKFSISRGIHESPIPIFSSEE